MLWMSPGKVTVSEYNYYTGNRKTTFPAKQNIALNHFKNPWEAALRWCLGAAVTFAFLCCLMNWTCQHLWLFKRWALKWSYPWLVSFSKWYKFRPKLFFLIHTDNLQHTLITPTGGTVPWLTVLILLQAKVAVLSGNKKNSPLFHLKMCFKKIKTSLKCLAHSSRLRKKQM